MWQWQPWCGIAVCEGRSEDGKNRATTCRDDVGDEGTSARKVRVYACYCVCVCV
jgi:hypothetical protein